MGNAAFSVAQADATFTWPRDQVYIKLTVTSTGSSTASRSVSDEFILHVIDECYSNVLSVSTAPSDVYYLIDDAGSTAAVTEYATVTGSWTETRCPLTRTVEIWDATAGDFIAFDPGVHTWASVADQSASNSRIAFTVDTESGTTLDHQYVDETLYHLRVKTVDPYSADASNPVYQAFDVSFNYEC